MKWLNKRHSKAAAMEAKERASVALEESRERWHEVIRVSTSLRELGEQNHFAASIRVIFQGGQPHEQ